jgi:hypothetical protein
MSPFSSTSIATGVGYQGFSGNQFNFKTRGQLKGLQGLGRAKPPLAGLVSGTVAVLVATAGGKKKKDQ